MLGKVRGSETARGGGATPILQQVEVGRLPLLEVGLFGDLAEEVVMAKL